MLIKRGVIWAIQPTRYAFSASSLMGLEMLPLGRRLILELLLDELASAGVTEAYLLSNASVPSPLLEWDARDDGEVLGWCLPTRALDGANRIKLHRMSMPGDSTVGDGLLAVESFLQGEPFLLIEANTVWASLPGQPAMAARLVDALEDAGADAVIAAQEITPAEIPIHTVIRSIGGIDSKQSFFVRDLIEHPTPGEEASRFALAGRYACRPVILDYLKDAPRQHRVDLVAAMRRLAHDRDAVWATRPLHGEHCFGLSNLLQYARAFLNYALDDPEIGLAVRDYMEDLIGVRWA
jgi:UTP-glucose-1-phosphate uridylyltransferase